MHKAGKTLEDVRDDPRVQFDAECLDFSPPPLPPRNPLLVTHRSGLVSSSSARYSCFDSRPYRHGRRRASVLPNADAVVVVAEGTDH